MVIVPPFIAIPKVSELLTVPSVKVGAQNMHWERNGAFTGESVRAMLRELFVRYVVLGHSERRALFGETDEIVNRKVRAAYEEVLRPIVCVGETLAQRERGTSNGCSRRSCTAAWPTWKRKDLQETVIAYEPVWAIGTGKTATSAQAQEAHAFIRQILAEMTDAATANQMRIQYGGSVKPDNARNYSRNQTSTARSSAAPASIREFCGDREGRRAGRFVALSRRRSFTAAARRRLPPGRCRSRRSPRGRARCNYPPAKCSRRSTLSGR